ncbi:hypothetical protein GUJ93_ZPchr0005g15910 [Zizania palustris]|uniref:Folate-biopterin transporter 7 n=1 Tax=Zizania palustris TaxID=103762 RepID=A0A8J5VG58_ZIZPA|nr:hypothetical protein GUJ93_ZPchr0005g15910 [Zizania palustris]
MEKEKKLEGERVEATRRWVIGVGFWVQGFRLFPWLGVNFFLKDGMGVAASSLQILQASANLPMVAKSLVGLISDAVPIRGYRRLPYVAIGALLQAISWLAIALCPAISLPVLTILLLLSNFGASICEVANDAIVAEAGKQATSSSGSGQLQSFAWMFGSSGGALGNLLCTTVAVPESSLKLPKADTNISAVSSILSYAVIPFLLGTMFFYQTEVLRLDSSVIGLSKGIYRDFGMPDSIYTIVFSGLLEGLVLFKVLPFCVLVAKLCPGGCEGSVMAFVMSALALATIVSGYLGVALAEFMGVSGGDFSELPACLLIEAACTMLPLCFFSLIKERRQKEKKGE